MQSLLKFPKQEKSALLPHLVDLMQFCWKEGWVPQDMRDAKIVTLFINKGGRNYCNNYRGISLLRIGGKVFARVELKEYRYWINVRIQSHNAALDLVNPLLTIFCETTPWKCREQRQPLYLAFVHLAKACYFLSRDGLFKIIQKIGCPPF